MQMMYANDVNAQPRLSHLKAGGQGHQTVNVDVV